jgi:hypothetical protein
VFVNSGLISTHQISSVSFKLCGFPDFIWCRAMSGSSKKVRDFVARVKNGFFWAIMSLWVTVYNYK